MLVSSQLLICKGCLAEQTRNFELAETFYEEAIFRKREEGGTAENLNLLALMLVRLSRFYLDRGRLVAAEATANEALGIRRLFALAGIQGSKDKLQEATELLERLYTDVGRTFELSLLRKSLDIPMRRSR